MRNETKTMTINNNTYNVMTIHKIQILKRRRNNSTGFHKIFKISQFFPSQSVASWSLEIVSNIATSSITSWKLEEWFLSLGKTWNYKDVNQWTIIFIFTLTMRWILFSNMFPMDLLVVTADLLVERLIFI